jgi:hypothetical protein
LLCLIGASQGHEKAQPDFPSETLEMSVAELSRIFETKTKETSHPDMRGPNQPVRQQPQLLVKDRQDDE